MTDAGKKALVADIHDALQDETLASFPDFTDAVRELIDYAKNLEEAFANNIGEIARFSPWHEKEPKEGNNYAPALNAIAMTDGKKALGELAQTIGKEKWFYSPIPLDANGEGPCNEDDCVRISHEIWDAAHCTVAGRGNKEKAEDFAKLPDRIRAIAAYVATLEARATAAEERVKRLEATIKLAFEYPEEFRRAALAGDKP